MTSCWVIDALATYRLSRLVATDTFPPVKALRDRWYAQHPPPGGVVDTVHPGEIADPDSTVDPDRYISLDGATVIDLEGDPLGEVVQCRWCNSVWIAAGVVMARRVAPRLWDPVARLLAASAVAGLLAGHETD